MHQINDAVVTGGKIILANLPFADGQHVQVIVSEVDVAAGKKTIHEVHRARWVDDDPRLKRSVRDAFDAERDVRVSAISMLEIATAASLNIAAVCTSVSVLLYVTYGIFISF
jgi:hypothetical protein